jgi:hypothetical protein
MGMPALPVRELLEHRSSATTMARAATTVSHSSGSVAREWMSPMPGARSVMLCDGLHDDTAACNAPGRSGHKLTQFESKRWNQLTTFPAFKRAET